MKLILKSNLRIHGHHHQGHQIRDRESPRDGGREARHGAEDGGHWDDRAPSLASRRLLPTRGRGAR